MRNFIFWGFYLQNGRWRPFWMTEIAFDRISRHFRSIRSFLKKKFKWPPVAILDSDFAKIDRDLPL